MYRTGIDVFHCWTGSDQYLAAFKVARPIQNLADVLDDLFNRSQTAGTVCAAGHLTDLRLNHVDAATHQRVQIGLHRRMLPHPRIHRRRDNNWRLDR